jgi:eukaryotic-like serine/threonine-protein kinase
MDSIGHIVDGRYVITYRIHIGRMATVYLARDQFLHRSVVLKVLHPSLAAVPAYVERFRREACIAAALSHPNLISVYNLGAYAGTWYIVMEHVTGPSLGQSLRIGGRVSEVRALEVTAQVAAALTVAHDRGVVHRDIGSHTVLLAAHGQVKITDFGGASTADICAPHPAQPATAAPPVRSDTQADLYNLGLMLYEMLTGSPIVAADGAPCDAEMMSPSAWARLHLSPPTDAIVRCALSPHAAFRFATAEAMRAASEEALTRIAIEASRSGHLHAAPMRPTVGPTDRHSRPGIFDLFRPRSTRLAS